MMKSFFVLSTVLFSLPAIAQYPEDMDPRAAAAPVTTVQTEVIKDVTPEAEKLCIEGLEAIDNGETVKGRELLEKAAAMNNPQAMYNLGVYYLKGINGFEHNDAEALKWFNAGCELNDAESAYQLGMMTYRGQGTTADEAMALEYLKKASDLGYSRAKRMIDQIKDR